MSFGMKLEKCDKRGRLIAVLGMDDLPFNSSCELSMATEKVLTLLVMSYQLSSSSIQERFRPVHHMQDKSLLNLGQIANALAQ